MALLGVVYIVRWDRCDPSQCTRPRVNLVRAPFSKIEAWLYEVFVLHVNYVPFNDFYRIWSCSIELR